MRRHRRVARDGLVEGVAVVDHADEARERGHDADADGAGDHGQLQQVLLCERRTGVPAGGGREQDYTGQLHQVEPGGRFGLLGHVGQDLPLRWCSVSGKSWEDEATERGRGGVFMEKMD